MKKTTKSMKQALVIGIKNHGIEGLAELGLLAKHYTAEDIQWAILEAAKERKAEGGRGVAPGAGEEDTEVLVGRLAEAAPHAALGHEMADVDGESVCLSCLDGCFRERAA